MNNEHVEIQNHQVDYRTRAAKKFDAKDFIVKYNVFFHTRGIDHIVELVVGCLFHRPKCFQFVETKRPFVSRQYRNAVGYFNRRHRFVGRFRSGSWQHDVEYIADELGIYQCRRINPRNSHFRSFRHGAWLHNRAAGLVQQNVSVCNFACDDDHGPRLAFMMTNGQPVRLPLDQASTQIVNDFGNTFIPVIGIPWPILLGAVVVALFYLLMKYTAFGRLIVATGSNETAVLLAGINVKKI